MISGSNEQQQLEYTLLEPDCHSWWSSKMQSRHEDTLEEWYAIKFCFKLGKNAATEIWNVSDCFWTDHLAGIKHQFLCDIRDYRKTGSLWGMMRDVGGVRKSIDQSWLAKGFGLGLLCWGFKGVQQDFPLEEASTLQILLPVTFGYSLSSEAVVMRQLRRWKRLWQRSLTRWHKRTSIGPSRSSWNGTTSALQPEEITSKGTRVSCAYYQ